MNPRRNGGQAFPNEVTLGMNLLDYFAANAMQVAISVQDDALNSEPFSIPEVAAFAYAMADAMLAERERINQLARDELAHLEARK